MTDQDEHGEGCVNCEEVRGGLMMSVMTNLMLMIDEKGLSSSSAMVLRQVEKILDSMDPPSSSSNMVAWT